MSVGRILVDGRDQGGGFALVPNLVITANHVVRGFEAPSLAFAIQGFEPVAVETVERDAVLDIALLRLARTVPSDLATGQVANGAAWRVEERPRGNDPVLTGTVDSDHRRLINAQGHEVEVLQLRVDQHLGDYKGYSGAAVMAQSPRGAVVGVLIEQLGWRLPESLGQPPPATNVLYAIPIQRVLSRFSLTAHSVARPMRFNAPRPPETMINRSRLLTALLDVVIGGAANPTAVILAKGIGGMGKTVLAQQVAHDTRTWRAFPGGVLWATAGEAATDAAVLDQLGMRPHIDSQADLDKSPILVIVDDVWSEEILARIRSRLPNNVTVLATTRGVTIVGAPAVRIDRMLREEAVTLLLQARSTTTDLRAALVDLAEAMGCWPLLLGMAARYLHLNEIDIDIDEMEVGVTRLEPDQLTNRAKQLRDEFARDPTILDDPNSQQRSLTLIIERSIAALGQTDVLGLAHLATYPRDVDLTPTLLTDVWGVGRVAAEQRMRRLGQVGLGRIVTLRPLSRTKPPVLTLQVHDLVMDWLHQRYGDPNDLVHRVDHRRCVEMVMGRGAMTGDLTEERADWLAFHLCRTGRVDDPARLLQRGWRAAYWAATGTDAAYLAALRAIVQHYGNSPDAACAGNVASAQLEAWMLQGALLHAHTIALVAAVPIDALVTLAVLGQPAPALRQAAQHPSPLVGSTGLIEIVTTLQNHGALLPAVTDLTVELAEGLHHVGARSQALAHIARLLAPYDLDRAADLANRALSVAEAISREGDRSRALSAVAAAFTLPNPDRALSLAVRALEVAETIPDQRDRNEALGAVAVALAPHDPRRAIQVAKALPTFFSIRDAKPHHIVTLIAVAKVLTLSDPDWARDLTIRALQTAQAEVTELWTSPDLCSGMLAAVSKALGTYDPEEAVRHATLALWFAEKSDFNILKEMKLANAAIALAPHDPEQALHVAESLPPGSPRSQTLAAVARALVPRDQKRAAQLAAKTLEAGEVAPFEAYRPQVLGTLAELLADHDPDNALQVTEILPEGQAKRRTIAAVARALAADNPGMDGEPGVRALQVAAALPDGRDYGRTLAEIARQVAAYDRDRAAELVTEAVQVAAALPMAVCSRLMAEIGLMVATYDPNWAKHLAARTLRMPLNLSEEQHRNQTLAEVALGVATYAPHLALQATESLPEDYRSWVVAAVARGLAGDDPNRALGVAETISDQEVRSEVLGIVAGRMAEKKRLLGILSQYWSDLPNCLLLAQAFVRTRAKNSPIGEFRTLVIPIIDALSRTDHPNHAPVSIDL